MQRFLTGLAMATLLLTGCASGPGPQKSGMYHAPSRAYSLSLDSSVFRGAVSMTEQCDANGGTLNLWDETGRFFRVDYLKINKHPVADVPNFASERTIDEMILNKYLREVVAVAPGIKSTEVRLSEFVETGRGDAMFSVSSIEMKPEALPSGVQAKSYFYGFLVFTKGDFVYVLQHRFDAYQPDKMKNLLSSMRLDMLVPGMLRHNESTKSAPSSKKPGGC